MIAKISIIVTFIIMLSIVLVFTTFIFIVFLSIYRNKKQISNKTLDKGKIVVYLVDENNEAKNSFDFDSKKEGENFSKELKELFNKYNKKGYLSIDNNEGTINIF